METSKQRQGRIRVYLKPGELLISQRPLVVTTVLGSCVSVTLFHRPSGLAAICHALQPRCQQPSAVCLHPCRKRYRYTACVIEEMVLRMAEYGAHLEELETKLFGGAALIGSGNSLNTANSVGQQNVAAATEALMRAGLILKVSNVGGSFGRKLIFDTSSGEVLLKRIRPSAVPWASSQTGQEI